jgi:hypothetical protein
MVNVLYGKFSIKIITFILKFFNYIQHSLVCSFFSLLNNNNNKNNSINNSINNSKKKKKKKKQNKINEFYINKTLQHLCAIIISTMIILTIIWDIILLLDLFIGIMCKRMYGARHFNTIIHAYILNLKNERQKIQ